MRHRVPSPGSLVALALVGATACGSKGSVSLSGEIREPRVTVEQAALGTFVSAELDLFVELGAYAGEHARIESATFSLLDDAAQAQIGPPLDMIPERPLPLELAEGDSLIVHFATGAAAEPIGEDLAGELCAGTLALRGDVAYVMDGEHVLDVRSAAFTPDGC